MNKLEVCKKGHPIIPGAEGADVYIRKDGRADCRICRRVRQKGMRIQDKNKVSDNQKDIRGMFGNP